MPLANLRFGSVAPLPVSEPPSSSQISARPEPLCSPNARMAPGPRAWSRRPSPIERAVEQRGIAGERAVGADQRVRRQRLAATARDVDLALRDQRGREVEHDRSAPSRGMPTQNGAVDSRRSTPPNGATRIEPRGVDEMDRNQARRRRALRPFADAADMAGVAQRDRRKPRRLRLLDADVDGLRRDGLAEAEAAVDHRDDRRIDAGARSSGSGTMSPERTQST